MSIWVHNDVNQEPVAVTAAQRCQFCDVDLVLSEIQDHWIGISQGVSALHERTVHNMAEIHDDAILRELDFTADPKEYPAALGICPHCGWWVVSKQVELYTQTQIWFVEYGAAAVLRQFDDTDIRIPVAEVRQYLAAKYGNRYNVNPRRFEEVVASVFSSFGFTAEVTALSADGGIDVVLRDSSGQVVGVQVKRYKGAIEVSQIRELLGAMVLGGYTKGIFVTTSRFQSGAADIVKVASSKGLGIELIDGEAFLKRLHLSQSIDSNRYARSLGDNILSSLKLQYLVECHGNSL